MKLKITEQEKKDILEQYQDEKILEIPGFMIFNNDWNLLMSFLNKRGNPKWKMMGNLDLSENQDVTDLNNLVSVEGYLDLAGTQITDLGGLRYVGGTLDLSKSTITTLGDLQSVGRSLNLSQTRVRSLSKLETVGGNLHLSLSSVTYLGDLKTVGGYMNYTGTPLSKQKTKDEIEQMLSVRDGAFR